MPQPLDLHFRIGRTRGGVRFIRQPRDAVPPCVLRSELSFLLVLSLLVAIASNSCGGLVSSSAPPPPVIVTVTPSSAQPFAGATVPFTAQVQNAGSSAVSWEVNTIQGGNLTVGIISDSGVYTAPDTVPTPATVTVTAVLQTDPTKAASSSVTIQSQSSIRGPITISPSLTTSQSLQLQVKTTGVRNDQVN